MRPRVFWIVYVSLAAVLVGAQIFWPPPLGLANNGDFSKVAGYYDLGPKEGWARDEYKYFVASYVFSPEFHWESRLVSSEHLFAWAAVRASQALISRQHFDIRMLGFVHLLALLFAFAGAIVIFSTFTPLRAAGLALFTLFVFTDVVYASYLNSFYMDTAAMLFVFTTIVSAIGCAMTTGRRSAWMLCLTVSGILLIASKMQHSVLGMPLCFLAVVNSVRSRKRMRIAWIVISLMWLLTMIAMTRSSDPQYKTPPLFTTIFWKIGKNSADPTRDFQELALGPEYVRLKGLFAYADGSPMEDPNWRATFLRKTGFGKVLLFYLRHPSRALGLVWDDLKEYGPRNPDRGLSNYRREEGFAPDKLSPNFAAWHAFRNYMFWQYPVHIAVIFIVSLAFCLTCCASAAMRDRFPMWPCFLTVVLMAALALAVATLADAADTARHLFLFHTLTDIMLCFWLSTLLDFRTGRAQPRGA